MNRRRRKTNRMKRKPFLPLRWVIYLLLLTMLATGVSLSRYKTTVAGSGTVSVARPVVVYLPGSGWEGTGTHDAFMPGQTLERHFLVQNYDGGVQIEVSMAYFIEVNDASSRLLPLDYALYALDGSVWVPYAEGDLVSMGFAGPESHQYKLVISWDAGDNADRYMNKTQDISIDVSAYQVNN